MEAPPGEYDLTTSARQRRGLSPPLTKYLVIMFENMFFYILEMSLQLSRVIETIKVEFGSSAPTFHIPNVT